MRLELLCKRERIFLSTGNGQTRLGKEAPKEIELANRLNSNHTTQRRSDELASFKSFLHLMREYYSSHLENLGNNNGGGGT